MPTIANLNVGLNMQTGGFTAGISAAASKLAMFGLAVQGAQKILNGLETAMSAIVDQLKKIDEVGDLAGNLGMTTEELSRLQYAAKQTDSSVESLNTALRRLASSRPLQSFADSVEEIQRSTDKAEKAREIFGRGWTEIGSLLRLSRQEIEQLGRESDALGNTISGSMAAAANDATNAIQRLADSFEGLKNILSLVAAGPLTDFVNNLTRAVAGVQIMVRALENMNFNFKLAALIAPFAGLIGSTPTKPNQEWMSFMLDAIHQIEELEKALAPKGQPRDRRFPEDRRPGGPSLIFELEMQKPAMQAAVSASVGAALRFTSAGFSAAQGGKQELNRLAELAKQQLDQERQQLDVLNEIRDGLAVNEAGVLKI